jgi:hypothetical protein
MTLVREELTGDSAAPCRTNITWLGGSGGTVKGDKRERRGALAGVHSSVLLPAPLYHGDPPSEDKGFVTSGHVKKHYVMVCLVTAVSGNISVGQRLRRRGRRC